MKKIDMRRVTYTGIVECVGEFAIEKAGYKFYFVKVDSMVYLIEYSTGCAIGLPSTINEYGYKKKQISDLDTRSEDEIEKVIEKQISLFKKENIEYPINK